MNATGTEMSGRGAGLQVDGIVKSYGGTTVLHGISVTVAPGEVVGLVGHNGAGKSTLMKCISGAAKADSGSVTVDGEAVRLGDPTASIEAGIATVYQELSLLPNLTVMENVFLGREKKRGGLLSKESMRQASRELIEEFELGIDPDTPVSEIPVAIRQLLEVAIRTHRNARYLLLDEPTTSLEGNQVARFLDTVQSLAARGFGIVLVNHKLEELYEVCSRVVALVDGEVRIDAKVGEVGRDEVVAAIAGEDIDVSTLGHKPHAPAPSDAKVTVEARGLTTRTLRDVNLRAYEGRILGIYGLVGAGRTETLRAIAGIDRIEGGELIVDGAKRHPRSPSEASKLGIAYVTEERKQDGIVPQLDSTLNLMLPVLSTVSTAGFLRRRAMHRRADELMNVMRVRGNRQAPVERLSGGNQQKVILARALAQKPKILLLDEPTKGVDLGVKAEIHRLIRSLAHDEGLTVILVSSEEEEVADVADDVMVMSGGHADGEYVADDDRTPHALRRIAWAAA
ncbi:sugar ABC transporter ATP-binding protein [Leucobacter tenebrionis]|uniref:sugar ABC transporter ATP-binding protein n=1 Tax=Leucobacter tenebrionis TaxID=2873270 RepID=UPI001CA7AA53|nr:sugar ABC transporter ATP-binding protein [Leucobacter tenebrionis]QZY52954.1 sugar ABC transporter ATP-binding protein [Leucobacter tenebrionis]